MDWEFVGGIAVVVVVMLVLIVVSIRNMNHGYTIGSGMFKMSDNNLEKDKHMDSADYDYYKDDGILK